MVQSADAETQVAPPAREAGSLVLERYRLVRRLGAGAFGVVWLAHDERLDRMVAVKRIPCHDGRAAARATREALAAARLAHPGIVALHEAGRDEEAVHLVSEFVRGRTLAELEEAGALSDRDVLRIGAALCDALEHAHARGVVHRDVKPANVIVPDEPQSEAGVAKLTDFGVAWILGDDALTRTGDVVGTLAYMAPEQAEGCAVSGESDCYALGLVLYEALSGVNPVRASGAAATARNVGTRLPPLRRLRRDLPPELCAAIDAAVWPHADERAALDDLRAALDAARDDVGSEVGPVAEPRDAPRARQPDDAEATAPGPRAGGRRARLAAGVAAGALVIATLALLPGAWPAERQVAWLAAVAAAVAVALLPRAGWLAAAAVLLAALAAAGSAGTAVILLAALLPVPLLLPRAGRLWSVPAGAPLLGLVGLALAWPTLAAQAAGARRRAALGALGLWWLVLAEALTGPALLLGDVPGTPVRGAWEDSAAAAAREVLVPLATSGAPALALVWALAAAALPVLVRGRRAGADLVVVTGWAAGLAASSAALVSALPWPTGEPSVRGLLAGAIAAAALALIAAGGREGR